MKQPPGSDFLTHVCKLKHFIYSLKQAPRVWFEKLSDHFITLGFKCSNFDSSLFVMRTTSACLYILVYVDDILVTGSSSRLIIDFINTLKSYFPIKDLGVLRYFLGIEVQ